MAVKSPLEMIGFQAATDLENEYYHASRRHADQRADDGFAAAMKIVTQACEAMSQHYSANTEPRRTLVMLLLLTMISGSLPEIVAKFMVGRHAGYFKEESYEVHMQAIDKVNNVTNGLMKCFLQEMLNS